MIPTPTQALVRRLAESYANLHPGVSLARAREQYAAYVQALRSAGLEVKFVEADDTRPDCVFVEDTAIVWDGQALLTRMSPHREGEQAGVEDALRPTHRISRVAPPGKLEGGDVLHVEDTTYVGLTGRTNEAGVETLREFLTPFGQRIVAVPVENCLHLKSGVSYLGDATMIVAPELVPAHAFDVPEVIETAREEEYAANCVRLGSFLLVPAGFPQTEKKLRRFAESRGVEIVPLDCSEFRKGGGSLTCLSLLW